MIATGVRIGAIVFPILLFGGEASAQTIRGRVLSELDGRQVEQVQVSVLLAQRDSAVASTLSATGDFLFDLPDAGSYRLRVQALGYAALTTTAVKVEPVTLVVVEVRLRADALALEPLRVVAERLEPFFMRDVRRRQHLGFGRLLTREDLDQRFGSRLDDVLRDTGLWVEQAQLSGNRAVPLVSGHSSARRALTGQPCFAALYLNGVRQYPSILPSLGKTPLERRYGSAEGLDRAWDLFQFRPQDVEAIEIYKSRGETPAEWADEHSDCGVVAVWLRGGYNAGDDRSMPPTPNVTLNLTAARYGFTGTLAPEHGVAVEATAYWRLYRRVSLGVGLRRSVHTLAAEATAALMRDMNPALFVLTPGARSMSLYVASVEPRLELLPRTSPIVPSAAVRLQLGRRGFAIERPHVENRENRFVSYGLGIGGALGLGVRVIGRVGLEVAVARDRLSFGEYRTIKLPDKETGASWTTTSFRAGITTRL